MRLDLQWTVVAPGVMAVEIMFGPLKTGLMLPFPQMRTFLEDGLAKLNAADRAVQVVPASALPSNGRTS